MKRVLFACLSIFVCVGCKGKLGNEEELPYKKETWNPTIQKFTSCGEIDNYLYEYRRPPILYLASSDASAQKVESQPYENQIQGVSEGDILQVTSDFFFFARPDKIEVVSREPFALYKSLSTPKSILQWVLSYNDKLIYLGSDITKSTMQIYDVKADFKKISEKEFEGTILDFRLVSDKLRVITRESYYDQGKRIDCAQIYRPNFEDGDSLMTLVHQVDLGREAFPVATTGFMGRADFSFITADELLLFKNTYDLPSHFRVVKFDSNQPILDQAQTYQGAIKDRWSIFSKDNSIIFATTIMHNNWSILENKIFTYEKMRGLQYELASESPGFGHNESIRAVRYFMDKAYVVTFQEYDPLFVFDIKDTRNVKLLSSLESPGYSMQLRELTNGSMFGMGLADNSNGLKVSLFNVLDPLKLSEIQTLNWGVGTYGSSASSEALTDPKALFISQEKDRLIFPIRITESLALPAPQYPNSSSDCVGGDYPSRSYSAGAVVLDFHGAQLSEVGRITHQALREMSCKDISYSVPIGWDVQRAVQIQGSIFSFSRFGVLRSSAADLTSKEQVPFDTSGINCWYGY